MHDMLKAHPELKDAKNAPPELESKMAELQGAVEQLPREAQELGRGICRETEPQGSDRIQLIPSALETGPDGMFSVTLSRLSDEYRDKAPEPFGIGEPRQRIFVDTTPGVAGIQFYAQDIAPRPRPEFLQTVAAATGRLPEGVARDSKMFNASAENPIKQQLAEPLKLMAEVVTLAVGPDGKPIADPSQLDGPTKARFEELEARAKTLEEANPKLRDATGELFDVVTARDPIPCKYVDHGNGIFELNLMTQPRGDSEVPGDGGKLFVDLRPGLAGYCAYYQPGADSEK
jgi:hypothetical protein